MFAIGPSTGFDMSPRYLGLNTSSLIASTPFVSINCIMFPAFVRNLFLKKICLLEASNVGLITTQALSLI